MPNVGLLCVQKALWDSVPQHHGHSPLPQGLHLKPLTDSLSFSVQLVSFSCGQWARQIHNYGKDSLQTAFSWIHREAWNLVEEKQDVRASKH